MPTARRRRPGAKGRARPPSIAPNPFSTMEIRKTLVVEALRSQGDMTKRQLLQYLDKPRSWLETNPPVLTLLITEGRIVKLHHSRDKRLFIYHADPDLATQLLTPEEHE